MFNMSMLKDLGHVLFILILALIEFVYVGGGGVGWDLKKKIFFLH